MATPLEFVFSLMDQASGPASKIAASLEGIESKLNALKSAGDPTGGLRDGMGSAGGSALSMGAAMGVASAGVNMLVDVAKSAASALSNLAMSTASMVVHAVDFRQNSEIAFGALAKSHGYAESASKLFDDAMKFAAATPFKADMIVGQYQKLLASGFTPVEIPIVLGGATDLAAATGRGAEGVQQLVGSFQRLKNEGKLGGEVLRSFAEAGVSKDALTKQLAGDLGKTPAAIKQMLEAGQIDADEGSYAIMEVIRKNISGGKIGELTEKQSQTTSGLWSTLESSALAFFSKIDIGPLNSALKTLTGFLDVTSDKGIVLKAEFESLFNDVFAKIGGALSPKSMSSAFDMAVGAIRGMKSAFDTVWPLLEAFGGGIWDGMKEAIVPLKAMFATFSSNKPGGADKWVSTLRTLGEAAGGAVVLIGGLVGAFAMFEAAYVTVVVGFAGGVGDALGTFAYNVGHTFDVIGMLPGRMLGLGGDIVDGLWSGIKGGWAAMLTGFSALVDLLPAAVKSALGIHSPSRVFAELGVYTAQGFQEGIEGETDNSRGALQTMVNPDLIRTASGRGAGGGSIVVNNTFEISGASDPKAVAEAAKESFTQMWIEMHEDVAMHTGAIGAPA